jgi:ABC-type uncharacterized transport system substrate-binding protein
METFCMDAKRQPSEAAKLKAAEAARERILSFVPDVVVTTDDIAQAYFARDFAGKPGPQFVFCGVNAEPELYGYPTNNVTGVLERPHFVETMALLTELCPTARTVAILSDDSETSRFMLQQMQRATGSAVRIAAIEQASTFLEWQNLVTKHQSGVDALAIVLYHTLKPEPGAPSMAPAEVFAWTQAHNRQPAVGFLEFTIRDGLLGGIAESGEEQGFECGLMVRELLGGRKASELPLKLARSGTVIIHAAALERLGLEVDFEVLDRADLILEQ